MAGLHVILGANGFMGTFLTSYFQHLGNADFKLLAKPAFDLCDGTTYNEIPPGKELIIFDTITVNNCNKTEINNVNILGQKNFIDWLNRNNVIYHYVYFSTLSTLRISEHLSNDYIVSKSIAENYVRNNCKNYTIIRLSFLFGKGENKLRLFSRIINNLKSGRDITVDDVFLNLTPIEELKIVLKNNDFLKCGEINFIDGVTYRLQELVSLMIEKIKPPESIITFTDKKINLAFNENYFSDGYTFKVREALVQMIDEV